MMTVHITCPECQSAVNIYPDTEASKAQCDICEHVIEVKFNQTSTQSELTQCPCCQRKDFYQQRDFNRKVGVALFVIAAILSIWTYGLSLFALYLVDVFLFKKLQTIAVCYKCKTIFRHVANIAKIPEYDHEMNDRIVYSDHDFQGKPLAH